MNDTEIVKVLFPRKEDIRLYSSNKYRSLIVISTLYFIIALCFLTLFLCNRISIPYVTAIKIIVFFIIGWSQYSISNGFHEAIHKNLPLKNDFWSALLTGYPIGFTISYRKIHLLHHRYLGTVNDPDYVFYSNFPKSRIALIYRVLYYVSGIPAFLQFFQLQMKQKQNDGKNEFFYLIVVQAIIFLTLFFLFDSIYYYFIFWILPLATVGKLFSSTRLLCEHGSPTGWVIRTIRGNRYRTWLFGAFDFNFHAEHHLVPSVPFAHLKNLHNLIHSKRSLKIIKESELFKNKIVYFDGGYLKLILYFFKILPWLPSKNYVK